MIHRVDVKHWPEVRNRLLRRKAKPALHEIATAAAAAAAKERKRKAEARDVEKQVDIAAHALVLLLYFDLVGPGSCSSRLHLPSHFLLSF